jgi:hypothetical protein
VHLERTLLHALLRHSRVSLHVYPRTWKCIAASR